MKLEYLFFVDRTYIDVIGDPRLEGLFLIQIKRHEEKNSNK